LVPAECRVRAATAFDCTAQRLGNRPGIVEQRQQENLRQRRVSNDVIEERRYRCGSGVALDQRRS
jgi:hypothetical protein